MCQRHAIIAHAYVRAGVAASECSAERVITFDSDGDMRQRHAIIAHAYVRAGVAAVQVQGHLSRIVCSDL
jgi:hypothetical protein